MRWFASLLFLLTCISSQAQSLVEIGEFLSSAKDTEALERSDKMISFLSNSFPGMPALDEVEFRTETDEFDILRQEYLVRFEFNSKKLRQAHEQYAFSAVELEQQRKKVMLAAGLKIRYRHIVAYLEAKRKLEFLKSTVIVSRDKIKMLETMAQVSSNFRLEDLFNAKEDKLEIERDIFEAEQELAETEWLLGDLFFTEERTALSEELLVSFSTMDSLMQEWFYLPGIHPEVLVEESQLARVGLEREIDIAETKQVLEFVQLKYAARGNLETWREFSLGAGIRLPMKGSAKIDLYENELERIEEEAELMEAQEELAVLLRRTYREWQTIYEKRNFLVSQIAESEKEYSQERLGQIAAKRPLAVLTIKERTFDAKEELMETEIELFEIFVEMMDFAGKLSEDPLLNYFSADLSPIPAPY